MPSHQFYHCRHLMKLQLHSVNLMCHEKIQFASDQLQNQMYKDLLHSNWTYNSWTNQNVFCFFRYYSLYQEKNPKFLIPEYDFKLKGGDVHLELLPPSVTKIWSPDIFMVFWDIVALNFDLIFWRAKTLGGEVLQLSRDFLSIY